MRFIILRVMYKLKQYSDPHDTELIEIFFTVCFIIVIVGVVYGYTR